MLNGGVENVPHFSAGLYDELDCDTEGASGTCKTFLRQPSWGGFEAGEVFEKGPVFKMPDVYSEDVEMNVFDAFSASSRINRTFNVDNHSARKDDAREVLKKEKLFESEEASNVGGACHERCFDTTFLFNSAAFVHSDEKEFRAAEGATNQARLHTPDRKINEILLLGDVLTESLLQTGRAIETRPPCSNCNLGETFLIDRDDLSTKLTGLEAEKLSQTLLLDHGAGYVQLGANKLGQTFLLDRDRVGLHSDQSRFADEKKLGQTFLLHRDEKNSTPLLSGGEKIRQECDVTFEVEDKRRSDVTSRTVLTSSLDNKNSNISLSLLDDAFCDTRAEFDKNIWEKGRKVSNKESAHGEALKSNGRYLKSSKSVPTMLETLSSNCIDFHRSGKPMKFALTTDIDSDRLANDRTYSLPTSQVSRVKSLSLNQKQCDAVALPTELKFAQRSRIPRPTLRDGCKTNPRPNLHGKDQTSSVRISNSLKCLSRNRTIQNKATEMTKSNRVKTTKFVPKRVLNFKTDGWKVDYYPNAANKRESQWFCNAKYSATVSKLNSGKIETCSARKSAPTSFECDNCCVKMDELRTNREKRRNSIGTFAVKKSASASQHQHASSGNMHLKNCFEQSGAASTLKDFPEKKTLATWENY